MPETDDGPINDFLLSNEYDLFDLEHLFVHVFVCSFGSLLRFKLSNINKKNCRRRYLRWTIRVNRVGRRGYLIVP